MENSNYLKDRNIQLEAEIIRLRELLDLHSISVENEEVSKFVATKEINPPNRHLLSTMLDNVTAMIAYWDKNLYNCYSNRAYSVWFGVASQNLLGKHILELLGNNCYHLNQPYIQAVLQGVPQRFEREIASSNGTDIKYALIEYIPDINNGQVEGFFVHISDITTIKLSEIALKKSEERYRTVVQDQTELISRLHGDGRYIFANEAFLTFFGKNESDLIGNNWVPLVFEDDIVHIENGLSKLSPENTVVMIENRVYSASGEVHWMQFSNRGTFDQSGQLTEIQSVGRDITKQKHAEQNLRLASVVFENTIEGILVTDTNGVIVTVNPAFTAITGFSSEEVIGKTPRIFKSGHHDQAFYKQMWKTCIEQDGWRGEVFNQFKNGEIHPFLMSITNVKDNNGETLNYVGIFTDNTENKKLEDKRKLNEVKYRNALVSEVHHRIKNNLQGVVLMMSNMSTTYPELTDPMESVMTKVNSIAIVHGLQGSNNSTVNIIDLVKSIVGNNQTLFNVPISLETSDITLPIYVIEKEAVPTALILNELLINAIKHNADLNAISIDINYIAEQQIISVHFKNKGRLSQDDSTLDQPKFGTGLQLVKSLMPKEGMKLFWKQDNDWVITTIELSNPIITIEPESAN